MEEKWSYPFQKAVNYSADLYNHTRTHLTTHTRGETVLSSGLVSDCVWKVSFNVETWTWQLHFGVAWFPHQSKEKWGSESGPMAEHKWGEGGLEERGDHTSTGSFTSRGVWVCVCVIEMEEAVHWGVVRGMALTVQLFKKFQKNSQTYATSLHFV